MVKDGDGQALFHHFERQISYLNHILQFLPTKTIYVYIHLKLGGSNSGEYFSGSMNQSNM